MMKWKELFEPSGGKLALSKCFYHILLWKYDDKGSASPLTIHKQKTMCDQITIIINDNLEEVFIVRMFYGC